MFRNLRINIFIYYIVTVSAFLVLFYYLLPSVEDITIFAVVIGCFVVLSGVFMAKLSTDPLLQYIKNLKSISRETLHELNLPITTIKTNLQMIEKNTEDKKLLKRLSRINNACDMLEQRYKELDYLIKMQSMQSVYERFDLSKLTKQRVEFLKNIHPNFDFRLDTSPCEIYNDKIGLSKTIDNLIDNAIKYSDKKQCIDIRCKKNKLSIQDYGKGIDEVELIKIFDESYQSDSDFKGFGIGLAMVKRFCDKNKIKLSITSKPNIGTTITLDFPQK